MSVIVDSKRANIILRAAITEVINSCDPKSFDLESALISESIKEVILGTHLTYRYILMTGLLSKATNEHCNPIALQAGSDLEGAYDARSICHGVLVPLERELLGAKLGGSNEPFLNKPARYKELSLLNAVRRGNDRRLLELSVKVLSSITSSEEAYHFLCNCICYVLMRKSRDLFDHISLDNTNSQQSSLINFAEKLVSQSFEGETCALLVGLTYDFIGFGYSQCFDVKVHKVNQAGSSSNEVLDVDVYFSSQLIHTIEVKDKQFTPEDVQHAVSKAVSAGCSSLVFAIGPRGALQKGSYSELIDFWGQRGFSLYFVSVMSHFISILAITFNVDIESVVSKLNYHAGTAKIKDDTFNHVLSCAKLLTQ